MNVIFKKQEGDHVKVLVEQGISADVDALLYGRLITTNLQTASTSARQVALLWDEQRNIVEVGGVDSLTGGEVALLEEAGFSVPDSFIPRAIL